MTIQENIELENAKIDAKPIPPISVTTHCPYRQASLLQEALTPNKMRIAFLIGAGCSTSIRIANDTGGSAPLIPDVAGLTAIVIKNLESVGAYKITLETILKRITDLNTRPSKTGNENSLAINIEQILSYVRTLREIVGSTSHDGLSLKALEDFEAEICSSITKVVEAELPHHETPFHNLATWINSIRREYSVEIFTPNYDLLLERALESRKVPYFDGFVGSDRTFFDQISIEADNLPVRWARLWKIHGSINWWRTKEGNIERRRHNSEKTEGRDRQMIYPSHLKYDQSRRLPYLTMLDKLRSFLGKGQSVLVSCGYSFSDQHLNEVILQGLNSNPMAICFGLLYGDRKSYPTAVDSARKCANLSILAADGGILGTIDRDWHCTDKSDNPLHDLAVKSGEVGSRSGSPPERCKFLLGDFDSLGQFLSRQHLALRDDSGEFVNGS